MIYEKLRRVFVAFIKRNRKKKKNNTIKIATSPKWVHFSKLLNTLQEFINWNFHVKVYSDSRKQSNVELETAKDTILWGGQD